MLIVAKFVTGPAIKKINAPPMLIVPVPTSDTANGIDAVAHTYNGIDKIKTIISSPIPPYDTSILNNSSGGLIAIKEASRIPINNGLAISCGSVIKPYSSISFKVFFSLVHSSKSASSSSSKNLITVSYTHLTLPTILLV